MENLIRTMKIHPVLGDHHLHRVLGQEPGRPGVVGALSTLVVAGQPVDVDLLPVGDQAAVDGGQRCLLGTLRPVAAAVGRRRSGPSTPTTGGTWSTEWGGPGSRGCVTTAGRPALNDERYSSMSSYPHLLSPGHYGSLELPNRIVMPAMRTRLAHQDGTPARGTRPSSWRGSAAASAWSPWGRCSSAPSSSPLSPAPRGSTPMRSCRACSTSPTPCTTPAAGSPPSSRWVQVGRERPSPAGRRPSRRRTTRGSPTRSSPAGR